MCSTLWCFENLGRVVAFGSRCDQGEPRRSRAGVVETRRLEPPPSRMGSTACLTTAAACSTGSRCVPNTCSRRPVREHRRLPHGGLARGAAAMRRTQDVPVIPRALRAGIHEHAPARFLGVPHRDSVDLVGEVGVPVSEDVCTRHLRHHTTLTIWPTARRLPAQRRAAATGTRPPVQSRPRRRELRRSENSAHWRRSYLR